jgi:Prealbumin-like fold domain
MATRILGPTGSRRRRRFLVLGPIVLVFALLLPTLVFASAVPPPGAPNDPTFEFDGNLLTELSQPGVLDWANPGNVAAHSAVITNATRTAAGSCTGSSTIPANFTLGGPNSVGQGLLVCDGTISKQTPNDANGFTQGQHEDEGENPINWVVKAVSSPKKTDLSEVYIYGKVFDSPFDADLLANNLMFIFDAGRLDTNGDFHVDFEMNQAAQTDCGDTNVDTVCQPRTVNDVLVSYDSVGGTAAPLATVFLWKTELDVGESCESSQGDINSPTLGGCYVLLDSPPAVGGFQAAQGAFNTTEIDAAPWKAVVCDPTSIESSQQCTLRSKIPAGGNMEGYIDIEGFVDNFDLCPGFGQISAKSRSSSGINASLQDTTGALPVDASICGSIIVEKLDGNGDPLPGASFTFDPDPLDRDGTAEIADGGTGDAADGDNGYVCVDDALFGSYDITETGVPAGYFGDTDTETINVTDPSTCAERLDEDGVPLDPADVDASFENLKGSIIIEKVAGDGTTLIPGAEFTITPSPVTGEDSLDVLDGDANDQADDSDGRICIDNVFIVDNAATDYDIVEKTPPPGWFGDGDTQTVTVGSPSTCADRLAEDPIVSDTEFVNLKGSIIIRKEAKNANTADAHDLFGGATFSISPNPLTGAAPPLSVTDDTANNTLDVDQFGGAGLICIDGVANLGGGSYSITETNSNNAAYKKDDDTVSVSVSSASTCSGRGTSATPDALFENIPLSKITVTFESLAGAGVTKAKIACPPEAADPTPDATPNAFDDTSESFTDLVPTSPATYNCTVEIDP